jgi:hypothetical protein
MGYLAGAVLILIGLFLMPFGKSSVPRSVVLDRQLGMPAWLDRALNWAIGLMCVWFGLALLFGRVRL